MKRLKVLATAACWLALAGAVQASPIPLEGRDINGNPVAADDPRAVFEYDANLNLTWLRNWNMNGPMNWSAAMTWASTLTVGAFGGWALPTTDALDTSCSSKLNDPGGGIPVSYYGYDCTGSAMGYLYYTELGNPADGPTSDTGPFQNVQTADSFYSSYWSSTEYAPNPTNAWHFFTDIGYQNNGLKTIATYAVAVRPGDVAASVPEPQTLALSCWPWARRW